MPERILIVKPSSLGDIIHTLPLLGLLKKYRPESEIDWVVSRGFEGLLQGHPLLGNCILIDKDNWKRPERSLKTLSEFIRLFRLLRERRYDVCIDAQGLLRSGLITLFSGAKKKIGFSDAREGAHLFYNTKVQGGRNIHAVNRYLKLLTPLGIYPEEIYFPLNHIVEKRPVDGPYYIVIPGARWQTKLWPSEYYAQLIRLLSHKAPFSEMKPILVGATSDKQRAQKINQLSGGEAFDLTGKTDLKELCSIIKGASFVITNDSGPMHIAAALNIKVFAIFGPTSPALTGPYGSNNVVLTAGISCQPCFKRSCKDLKCMYELLPERVFERILTDYISE